MIVWQWLWTLVFFIGLNLFTLLAVAIAIHGWQDISSLIRTLQSQHQHTEGAEAAASEQG